MILEDRADDTEVVPPITENKRCLMIPEGRADDTEVVPPTTENKRCLMIPEGRADDTEVVPPITENNRCLMILEGRAPSRPQIETFSTEPNVELRLLYRPKLYRLNSSLSGRGPTRTDCFHWVMAPTKSTSSAFRLREIACVDDNS